MSAVRERERTLPTTVGLMCKPNEDAMPLTLWQHAGLTRRQGCRLMCLLPSDPLHDWGDSSVDEQKAITLFEGDSSLTSVKVF